MTMWSSVTLLLAALSAVQAQNGSFAPRPVSLELGTLQQAVYALQQPDSGLELLLIPLVTAAESIIQVRHVF